MMKDDATETIDARDFECPLTLEAMRHPIQVFPSEKYYELLLLVVHINKNGLICPMTNLPITSAAYAYDFKKMIDKQCTESEKFKHYSKHELLNNFFKVINERGNRWCKSLAKSTLTGCTVGLISLLTYSQLMEDESEMTSQASSSLFLSIGTGLVDFALRSLNQHRFGLFSPVTMLAQYFFSPPKSQRSQIVIPDELRDLANIKAPQDPMQLNL